MNEKRRQLLMGVGAILVAMLLFPPFHMVGSGGMTINSGYAFILKPPSGWAVVNVGTLLLQWLFVVAVGAVGWFLLKDE